MYYLSFSYHPGNKRRVTGLWTHAQRPVFRRREIRRNGLCTFAGTLRTPISCCRCV
ncbi:unnamed protein product [Ixodes persulcatus]